MPASAPTTRTDFTIPRRHKRHMRISCNTLKLKPRQNEKTQMCLALPAQITQIDPATNMATVSIDGVKVEVSLALVDDVQVGDYVLVHVGYALNKIDEDEAIKTLALFAEAGLTTAS